MGTGALMSIRTSVFEKRVPANEGPHVTIRGYFNKNKSLPAHATLRTFHISGSTWIDNSMMFIKIRHTVGDDVSQAVDRSHAEFGQLP